MFMDSLLSCKIFAWIIRSMKCKIMPYTLINYKKNGKRAKRRVSLSYCMKDKCVSKMHCLLFQLLLKTLLGGVIYLIKANTGKFPNVKHTYTC